MIARTWRGATRASDAETYLTYLQQTGLADFRRVAGNRGALALRRITNGRAEFVVISFWESEEAIRDFAGDDIAQAVFYPEDERFLLDRDERVSHYEVVFDSTPVAHD
jgi:heme-degrading monooxygenase HmoA